MALLEVKNLRTTFDIHVGRVQAVRGIDFAIEAGETVGIVGESGCGKSVSMMSILRLLPKYASVECDRMMFDGIDLTRANDAALRAVEGDKIGMVFQDPMTSLNPLLTIGAQLAEPLRIHKKVSRREAGARALELLKTVDMPAPESRLRQSPHQVSGGQRQRVMIAMAIACGPKLVIADEPTTALDVTIQAQILDLMRDLQRKMNTAVVLITHDLGVIAGMCKRVIVMYAGKIVEQGAVRELFYGPRHPYTWGLLGSIPGTGGTAEAPGRLHSIPGTPPDLIAPPAGCPFAPRCRYAMNICLTQEPPETRLSDSHGARCYLLDTGAPKVTWGGGGA
ncbi:MAG: ABC transporter ATP-binding protein [Eubacteriales bacterium]|nr:ABC transporter ATP-binding protein [Eubacteriales bacterium]